jgi:hypothetical protein
MHPQHKRSQNARWAPEKGHPDGNKKERVRKAQRHGERQEAKQEIVERQDPKESDLYYDYDSEYGGGDMDFRGPRVREDPPARDCRNCGLPAKEHVKWKCLFMPGKYAAKTDVDIAAEYKAAYVSTGYGFDDPDYNDPMDDLNWDFA